MPERFSLCPPVSFHCRGVFYKGMDEMIDLLRDIRIIESKIRGLENTKRHIQEIIDKENSLKFIHENGINKSNTQSTDGDSIPYFMHISKYGEWLQYNTNPWCEWNQAIYRTIDIVEGKYDRTDARYKDLT